MLCYKDKCYCQPTDCENMKCFDRVTDEIFDAAEKWGLPVCVADYSEVCEYKVQKCGTTNTD